MTTSSVSMEAGGVSERSKVKLTLAFDPSELFDRVAAVGDGGDALGRRIVGAMLMSGQADFIDAVGMAFYGVTVEPTIATQEQP